METKLTPARSSRFLTVLIVIARYSLGLGILTYGIAKLCNYQFQVSAWTYDHPLIQASGRMLTWAFLGYEPWFQFLLGVSETIPGCSCSPGALGGLARCSCCR